MVITIAEEMIKKQTLASSEIQCKIKNIASLFDFIKQEFKKENYNAKQINENVLQLTSRKLIRRKIILVEDSVESNTVNVDVSSEIIIIPEPIRNWLDKRFLRLKNSVWLILFLVMAVLIPVIAVGYVYEKYLMLRIFGIIMLCSAGLFYILSALFNVLISKKRLKQKNHAVDLIERIKFVIMNYSEKETSGIFCWNCFSEIKKDEKICPNCEVSLKR